jgi:hypothetical protein
MSIKGIPRANSRKIKANARFKNESTVRILKIAFILTWLSGNGSDSTTSGCFFDGKK